VSNRQKIIAANAKRYSQIETVDSYLGEEYHKIRINRAIDMFNRRLLGSLNTPTEEICVLELASSTGTIAARICEECKCKVIASDCESAPLYYANERGIQTACFDASGDFPFSDNSFHGIFAGDIIEHIFDTSSFLFECSRVLKPNGVLLLTTPNLATLKDRILFLIGKTPSQIDPMHEYYFLHIRPFTYDCLKRCLVSTNFENIELTSNLVTLGGGKRNLLRSRLLARLIPTIGRSLIICCNRTL